MLKEHKKLIAALYLLLAAIAGYTVNTYDDKAAELLKPFVVEADANTTE